MAADKEGTEGCRPPQLPRGGFRALPWWGLPYCSPQQCPEVPGINQAGAIRSFFPEKGTVWTRLEGVRPTRDTSGPPRSRSRGPPGSRWNRI